MTTEPIDLGHALASFTTEWSPHIVTHVNDYEVRVVKIRGDFVWHRHTDTGEFFHVLDGEVDIALRDDAGEQRVVHLSPGCVFTVPRGVEHKPSSANGASMLLFEPAGTVNTGEPTETVPGHIRSTTGHHVANSH